MAAATGEERASDDNGHLVVTAIVVSMVLLNLAVALRLLSRKLLNLPLMADDYMIFLAAVSGLLVFICIRVLRSEKHRYL